MPTESIKNRVVQVTQHVEERAIRFTSREVTNALREKYDLPDDCRLEVHTTELREFDGMDSERVTGIRFDGLTFYCPKE